MFALFLITLVILGGGGMGLGFPFVENKWIRIKARRCEKRLLTGMAAEQVREDLTNIENAWERSEEDLVAAEKELDDWLSKG